MGYYIVTNNQPHNGDKPTRHLVNAKTKAQALSAVVEPIYTVVAAEQKDLIELSAAGVKVIEAK